MCVVRCNESQSIPCFFRNHKSQLSFAPPSQLKQDNLKNAVNFRQKLNARNQSEFEDITCSWRQARENARVQVIFSFICVSHWLGKLDNFCQLITARGTAKQTQTRITNK